MEFKTITDKILFIQKETSSVSLNYLDVNEETTNLYKNNIFHKEFPRFNKIPLPTPLNIKTQLLSAITKRESFRDFNLDTKISLEELSTILHYSFGLKYIENNNLNNSKRFVPSAGGNYPYEAYIYVNNNNQELKKGLYHYNIKTHSLVDLNASFSKETIQKINSEGLLENASIIIFISLLHKRTTYKYGIRGYRFLYLDTGHIAQNILLLSTSMDIKSCPVGGFKDKIVEKEILDAISSEEFPAYIIALGR